MQYASEQAEAMQNRPGKRRLFTKARLNTGITALVGMIVGGLVGLAVQVGIQSTGLLGPSVEALISEQAANFQDMRLRLETLKGLSTNPEVKRNLTDLGRLLERQNDLSKDAGAELSYLSNQVSELKEQQLDKAKFVGGADFWLKNGESITVGDPKQVFGLISARSNIADVNVSGTRKRLTVGDALPVAGATGNCIIFYKQAKPRADGRVGFDLACN